MGRSQEIRKDCKLYSSPRRECFNPRKLLHLARKLFSAQFSLPTNCLCVGDVDMVDVNAQRRPGTQSAYSHSSCLLTSRDEHSFKFERSFKF